MVPITWDEFKTFVYKFSRHSRTFVDNHWAKIEKNSQYQLEDAQDQAAHLEYLPAKLKIFDLIAALNGDVLICYLRKGLCLSIQARMNNPNHDLDLWEEAIEKVVDAKANAGLQLPLGTKQINSGCLRGNPLSIKKDREYEITWNDKAKSHTAPANASPTQAQASNNDKCYGSRRDYLATGLNASKVSKKKTRIKIGTKKT